MSTSGGVGVAPHKPKEPAPPPLPPGLKSNPKSKYEQEVVSQQSLEAIILTVSLLAAIGLTFYLWQFSASQWCLFVLSGLAGIIAGLLHSMKWFYRTVGDGEWELDRRWWRYLNPLVCGVMGLSIYIVFRAQLKGTENQGPSLTSNKDPLYAYSVGFLTGLFADNAMTKLRDIAHVLFGSAGEAAAKPKKARSSEPGHHQPGAPQPGPHQTGHQQAGHHADA